MWLLTLAEVVAAILLIAFAVFIVAAAVAGISESRKKARAYERQPGQTWEDYQKQVATIEQKAAQERERSQLAKQQEVRAKSKQRIIEIVNRASPAIVPYSDLQRRLGIDGDLVMQLVHELEDEGFLKKPRSRVELKQQIVDTINRAYPATVPSAELQRQLGIDTQTTEQLMRELANEGRINMGGQQELLRRDLEQRRLEILAAYPPRPASIPLTIPNRYTELHDPQEDDPRLRPLFQAADKEAEGRAGNRKGLGYCHHFWARKKQILLEKYGIDWKTPSELNPSTHYD